MSKALPKAQNPLLLRFHRLMDAFAKSDDERDFYLDKVEGFIVYVDLEKSEKELQELEKEILVDHPERYHIIPKMTFYEAKKFMEGFVNEKVYDIDTKEKLLDIIGSREARENFLEFIYDHLTELDKWQQYYHERSRIRIIEWLRKYDIVFVFEEDLELTKPVMEKVKENKFQNKVPKDINSVRDTLEAKAKTYYSNEALNPRPKRGRPPKQQQKVEIEPQLAEDIYTTVPPLLRHFLFAPDYSSNASTFSSKFDSEEQLLASLKGTTKVKVDSKLEALSQRLESLRHLSDRLKDFKVETEVPEAKSLKGMISTPESPEKEEGGGLSRLFSGVLPKKRGRPASKTELKDRIKEKKEKGVKKVTQINYKAKKKGE